MPAKAPGDGDGFVVGKKNGFVQVFVVGVHPDGFFVVLPIPEHG